MKRSVRKIWIIILLLVMTTITVSSGGQSQIQNKQAMTANISNRLSLNFQEIKVRVLLQLLAQFSGVNIIASHSVDGNITLHLENITWQQALDLILQTQGLGKKQLGNVLYVAPLQEIAEQEKQALEADQQLQDLGSLESILIPISYGKATDIATLLKTQGNSLLSKRGSVSADARTNTIWVQDIAARLTEIRRLIKQLDIPVKQVLIEARIVNMSDDYAKELGVRFGVSSSNHMSGTLAGANSMAGGASAADVDLANRLNVDLPAANVGEAGGAGSIGLALAHVGPGTLLDLELSAMESEGKGQVISSPRLMTADQQSANIQAGEEIPYQQETSSGATNVTFKNAVLSLEVTPQITPEGKINLNLKVNQDRVSDTRVVQGVPAIDTRSIESHVLVDNGQTVVLGGIYETSDGTKIKRIPFLSSIPVVGALFRNTLKTKTRTELLIFITPRIIEQVQAK